MYTSAFDLYKLLSQQHLPTVPRPVAAQEVTATADGCPPQGQHSRANGRSGGKPQRHQIKKATRVARIPHLKTIDE
jgi:hypothetical protein